MNIHMQDQEHKRKPMLSVILPSLNVGDYIGECLESLVTQSYQNIEIICVDAGSTDKTAEIIQRYRDKYKETFSFQCHLNTRKSYGFQVNLGIRNAQGKYIAILETDDYVDSHMYGSLIELAEEKDLDYVKADYLRVITLRDGSIFKEKIELLGTQRELYDKVLSPSEYPYLNANDYNVWKGIYRRSFLLENDIRFQESAGAAFQDIGFSEQVLACAQRGYYVNDAYYMYRCDRDEASVRSNKGLGYSCHEFQCLTGDDSLRQKIKCEPGLYWHMTQSFFGELDKVLELENYDCNSPFIAPHMGWFLAKLKEAMDKGILQKAQMYPWLLKKLTMILENRDEYINNLKQAHEKKKERAGRIRDFINTRKAVVFGAGVKGRSLLKEVILLDCAEIFITDNGEELWGQEIWGKTVCAPAELLTQDYKKSPIRFLVANKYHSAEIRQQLLDAGVKEEDIRENP